MSRFPLEVIDAYLIRARFRQLWLSVELAGPLDLGLLQPALKQITEVYPILRSRLVETGWRARWEVAPHSDDALPITVRHWDGKVETAQQWAAELLSGPYAVMVGQGEHDVLIVKLDHALGDFQALIQLTYLLAETIAKLETKPGYVLPAEPPGERGYGAYCRRLPREERRRIFQSGLKLMGVLKNNGQWKLPAHIDPAMPIDCVPIQHRFEPATVEQLENFGI